MSTRGLLSIFKREVVRAEDNPDPELSRLTALIYGKPAPVAPSARPVVQPPPVKPAPRPRLVFVFDFTASREIAWETKVPLTDALLTALPGQLDVALAWHGGNRVTFTCFESDARKLRDRAAGMRCKAGRTRLLDILTHVLQTEGVRTVVYVGDTFEESERRALALAKALAARGTRLIILHDAHSITFGGAEIFAAMAECTGGAVFPFDATALLRIKELLSAVAVLAVGGTPLLEAERDTMPAARLLLEHLGRGKGHKP